MALAWAYLVHLDRQMSASMSNARMMAEMGMAMNARWTPADAGFTFAMWTVMMIGMMAGSVAPMLLLFARVQISRGQRGASLAVLMFGLGYLAVWTGFSALATCAQWALHQAALLSPAMAVANPRLAGVVLLAAGAYQLTPWKGKCLTHCRTPLGFLMANWRDGISGAFLMGARHGAFCLGCCWALMCVLFAMGVMNLVWVAALAGFVLLEKIGPAGVLVARLAGVAMAAFGVLRFAAIA
ncbi:MAG TPA: DUF2182 domain-containing protein [Bryobacteraceae bacterium]|nr:DUF2182 domain-containing protein [Bryobacteraceae bacterium]